MKKYGNYPQGILTIGCALRQEYILEEPPIKRMRFNRVVVPLTMVKNESISTIKFLYDSDLTNADLTNSNLANSDLSRSLLIRTNLKNATIDNAQIFGVAVWDIQTEGLEQRNLEISTELGPSISVDNIEVAQFIYLLLNNEKVRDVIGTIAKKGVLILGRFSPKRKRILNAIREHLRKYDFLPIMFDFKTLVSPK